MTRCCLCREIAWASLERTDLPGSGYRCWDREKCRERVRAVVSSHLALADICDDRTTRDR
jgi:hypothetical protein